MQEQGLEQREWVAMAVQVRVHGQGLELELAQALGGVRATAQVSGRTGGGTSQQWKRTWKTKGKSYKWQTQ